ncbi:homeobox-leucine zipper protein HOX11-like [Rhodamnia argentea]|uniref:Homeobox-leucine zipper protein HOX11-like n=1 Tax=Rhodamnia argentea TaxID=178133 RepID=A0A8B8NTJ3_9MYRT|nr:homeobox-leucine zipper protein HOX11-like [Rhodamnia argentea]
MELALSLGDTSKSFSFLDKAPKMADDKDGSNRELGFCMGLGVSGRSSRRGDDDEDSDGGERESPAADRPRHHQHHPPSTLLQLHLLPFSPTNPRNNHHNRRPSTSQFRLPWLTDHLGSEPESSGGAGKSLDVNRFPAAAEEAEQSSPNSALSSFQMDFGIGTGGAGFRSGGSKRVDMEGDNERDCSRGSDDDDNGLTRKKLRLSKEQSAFLEESFKEHNTLNPKQKQALAKQLNLRPRQVEVWFQNRRARTKLKQTEIDCEYLKRCCETLTEENRRLQKELQELRALKTSQPFYMQLPATTLTMCPSCERVATTTPAASAAAAPAAAAPPLAKPKPRAYPFPHAPQRHHLPQAHQAAS